MTIPNEQGSSPAPDATRPVLDGMPANWQAVYNRLREGHAIAVMGQQDAPNDPEANAILHASTAAVRAFRQVYQQVSTQSLARQIDGLE